MLSRRCMAWDGSSGGGFCDWFRKVFIVLCCCIRAERRPSYDKTISYDQIYIVLEWCRSEADANFVFGRAQRLQGRNLVGQQWGSIRCHDPRLQCKYFRMNRCWHLRGRQSARSRFGKVEFHLVMLPERLLSKFQGSNAERREVRCGWLCLVFNIWNTE